MKITSANEDVRKLSFVDSLYKQMRIQTKAAIEDHGRIVELASIYLEDGLSDNECRELLVIEGLKREAAASYVQLAKSKHQHLDGRYEYSFQFEDVYGKRAVSTRNRGYGHFRSRFRNAGEYHFGDGQAAFVRDERHF